MCIIKIMDKIFTHPTLSTAFSGFGLKISSKIKNIFIKQKSITEIIPQISSIEDPISIDINAIKHSIDFDNIDRTEETFLRYFNKYKHRFNPNDVKMLNDLHQHSHSVSDNAKLLSSLLGLIESLTVQ